MNRQSEFPGGAATAAEGLRQQEALRRQVVGEELAPERGAWETLREAHRVARAPITASHPLGLETGELSRRTTSQNVERV